MGHGTRTPNVKLKKIIVRTREIDCICHVWSPCAPSDAKASDIHLFEPRGVVVIFHGLGGHSQFPTVKYLAILLAKHLFIVYGMDFPGHGLSPGVRGYIASASNLIHDGLAVTLYAKKMHSHLPLFLAGGSMGGSIALAVTNQLDVSGYNAATGGAFISGLMLLAPMISVSSVSKCHERTLRLMQKVCPRAALFPPAEDSLEVQFRDEERRKEAEEDEYNYKGSLRVASAYSCLKLMNIVHKSLRTLSVPFLCMIGNEDIIVDNGIVQTELIHLAPSKDKTLKQYDALHGLICEALPLRMQIEMDLLRWLCQRAITSQTPSPKRRTKQMQTQQTKTKQIHEEKPPLYSNGAISTTNFFQGQEI